jgi:gluconate 2-dehydrogenase gamma chain
MTGEKPGEAAMEKPGRHDAPSALERRGFLKSLGVAGVVGGVAALPAAAGAEMKMPGNAAQPAPATATATANQSAPAYIFFNPDEAVFIEKAVDTLIPSDAVGPGALESGVATYIDRQMAGAFGKGARLYMQGPFAEGTPQQGYQLPLLPSELIRAGIADAQAWCMSSRKDLFPSLSPGDRISVLTEIETGKAMFPTVPPAAFFAMLLQLTMEGYFADPIYGGNRNKAVWRMLGFPGVAGMYADKIEAYRNKPYPVEPQGIQDLV